MEVFCSHDQDGLIPHLSFGTNTEMDKVVEGGKEDTWVLAIILLCFSVLCLTAGVICLNKKTKSREQLVRNIQQISAPVKKSSKLSSPTNEVPSIHQECDSDKNSVIEWSIKL